MVRKAKIDSIDAGLKNAAWGILEDTWITNFGGNDSIPHGITNFPAINVSNAAASQEERGMLFLKMPPKPEGAGDVTRVRISLYILANIGPVGTDEVIQMTRMEQPSWDRSISSWNSRIEYEHITGSAEPEGAWSEPKPSVIQTDDVFDTGAVSKVLGGHIKVDHYTAFDIINVRGTAIEGFDWDSEHTLLLHFIGTNSATKDVVFLGRLASHGSAAIREFVPIVTVFYDLIPPKASADAAVDGDGFLDEPLELVIPTDDDSLPVPNYNFKPDTSRSGLHQKYMIGIYDDDVRSLTKGSFCFAERPIFRDIEGETQIVIPVGVTIDFDSVLQEVVMGDVPIGNLVGVGLLIITANLIQMGIDALPGADFGDFKSSSIRVRDGNILTFEVLHNITTTQTTDGAIIQSSDKPMQKLVVTPHVDDATSEFKVVMVYVNPRNASIDDVNDATLTDPVVNTVETMDFTNPSPASRTTIHYVNEILHIAIIPVSGDLPTKPIEIRTEDTDELVCVIPAGIAGPIYITVEDIDPGEVDPFSIINRDLEPFSIEITEASMIQTKRWFFRMWRRQNNTELNRPLRSNEIVVDPRVIVGLNPPLLDRTVNGVDADAGDTGDTVKVGVQFEQVPVDMDHVDFTFREDSFGKNIFRRVPLTDAVLVSILQVTSTYEYERLGTFANLYRYVSVNKGYAQAWAIVDLGTVQDVVMASREVAASLEATPRKGVRIGQEVTLDGKLTIPGAGNQTVTKYEFQSYIQDFSGPTGDGGLGPATLEDNLTDPIRRVKYTKHEIGTTLPKVVTAKLALTMSDADTGEAFADILIEDNVPQSLNGKTGGLLFKGSVISNIDDAQKRRRTVVPIEGHGTFNVDQGFGGFDVTIRGQTTGGRLSRTMDNIKELHRSQRFTEIIIPELSGEGKVRKVRGVVTGDLRVTHRYETKVDWTFPFHVEDDILEDSDGEVVLALKCGDAVEGARLGNCTEGGGDSPIGRLVRLEDTSKHPSEAGHVIDTFAIGDGTTLAGQFNVSLTAIIAGLKFRVVVYNAVTFGTATLKGESDIFDSNRNRTIGIRGIVVDQPV